MNTIQPPKYVIHILNTLERSGYEARLVGGCVRDTLLHRRPNDWDVATAAAPEAVTELFERTVPTGIRHGTVTVLYGGSACEVTTYRVEGAYSDHRRPDSVRFTSRLEEDLSRRDFTINAMAMDASLTLTDPFGGREDLSRRLIRCVGDSHERFTEDALRMLRAVRFAAQLDFALDSAALEAIAGCAPLCSALSPERVAAELRAVLASRDPDMVWLMADLGLLNAWLTPREGERTHLGALPRCARLAHFCSDLSRCGSITSTDTFLRSLRMDTRSVKTCSAAAEILASGSRDYKRLLRDYGEDAVLASYPKSRRLRAVLRSGECWSLASLAITGGELAALGYAGRELGEELRRLLEHVIDCPEDNRPEILCKLASERIEGYDRA
ncbi:MAG TPA: hypothetical protein IAD43_01205 [Candidatus Scatomorpha pullicola]|nr:hypothetical protein [Candidatus Scatomorpha pullicola]